MTDSSDGYDVVIIGAGLGGLVCGCYLAKAGLKVLIAEQHHKAGGYCSSFTRGGFRFDAAAHSFGGYREGGIVKKVFSELGMAGRLRIVRSDPSETIITPDYRLSYWADMRKTIEEFKRDFPDEQSNIEHFFRVMSSGSPQLFIKMRKLTFLDFLDGCFRNERIKTVLAIPLFTYSGLPPSAISFCAGATIFSEFLMDGGYYPAGGMQKLPEAMAETFKGYGGELRLSWRVKKIKTHQGKAVGIVGGRGEFIRAGQVVSNADARQTIFSMLGSGNVDGNFRNKIKAMVPSPSYFVAYLGLNGKLPYASPATTVSYFPHYDIKKACRRGREGQITAETGYIMRMSRDLTTLTTIVMAPFRNRMFWQQRKAAYMDALINHLGNTSVPGLRKHLQLCEAATPQTLWRYTGNYRGAAYGWAGIPSQFADIELKKPPCLQNLFLAGHWTTQGIGIPGVVYSGYATAQLIQKICRRNVR